MLFNRLAIVYSHSSPNAQRCRASGYNLGNQLELTEGSVSTETTTHLSSRWTWSVPSRKQTDTGYCSQSLGANHLTSTVRARESWRWKGLARAADAPVLGHNGGRHRGYNITIQYRRRRDMPRLRACVGYKAVAVGGAFCLAPDDNDPANRRQHVFPGSHHARTVFALTDSNWHR